MDEFKYDSSASSTEGYESGYEPQECSRSDSGRFSDNAANPGPAPRHGEPVDEQAQPTPAVSPQQAALQLLLDAGIDRKRYMHVHLVVSVGCKPRPHMWPPKPGGWLGWVHTAVLACGHAPSLANGDAGHKRLCSPQRRGFVSAEVGRQTGPKRR